MKGNDYLYVGLGIAAIYAAYRFTKPIANVLDAGSEWVTGENWSETLPKALPTPPNIVNAVYPIFSPFYDAVAGWFD